MSELDPPAANSQGDCAKISVWPPAIPIVLILSGYGLHNVWSLPLHLPVEATPRACIGGAIAFAAVGLGAWAIRTLRLRGESENPYLPTGQVIRSGPFLFTRNPMYLQMVLICFASAIGFDNGWLLLSAPACAAALYFLVIRHEEAYLENKFGEAYLEYKATTQRWF